MNLPAPSALALAFAAVALLACAHAENVRSTARSRSVYSSSIVKTFDPANLLSGCLYEGRWFANGAMVKTRLSCLRCICTRSALTCRHRACKPIADLPPKLCHVKLTRDSCCPELHCPEGIIKTELDEINMMEIATPPTLGQACVEGGNIYAGGSAMSSGVACEQCFCLKGVKRCVSPTCLPPPPHCVPRPTAGLCCPQRYYCEHYTAQDHAYDCMVNGKAVKEGDSVATTANCTACYCLKGLVRCQELGCAPPIHGCEPILKPGECCAHQYSCNAKKVPDQSPSSSKRPASTYNAVVARNDDRALHTQTAHTEAHTDKDIKGYANAFSNYTVRHVAFPHATKVDIINTIKVKRKTETFPPTSTKTQNNDTLMTTQRTFTAAKLIAETTELTTEKTTEQPEGTVKIVVNGTINCTAELSSTSLPLSIATNDTDKIQRESIPRMPIVNGIEAQTYSPNDIITDRPNDGDFDENDTFTINVTSSLNANTNSTSRPIPNASKIPVPVQLADAVNSSKKNKEDYDYDYTEPTLPPSLPNLKIIPFVAADAVVEDDIAKEELTYPMQEREDKFPVYYPTDAKDTTFTRRADIYHPTQYPVFISEKEGYTHKVDLTSDRYPGQNDLVHSYTVATSLGSNVNEMKTVTKVPTTSSTFVELQTPAVNLFSPPVETEGGFIPKGPGIIDEYYAVYPSTPSGPSMPHLTTSMQLDISKGECISDDGTRILEGATATIGCRDCSCTWGHLRCVPTLCRAPAGCEFRTGGSDSADHCCGDIVCHTENKTTTTSAPITVKTTEKLEHAVTNATTASVHPTQPAKIPQQTTSLPANTTFNQGSKHPSIVKQATRTTTTTPPTTTTTKALKKNETAPISTTTTTDQFITRQTTTTAPTTKHEVKDHEYEDDEDEGFSFGSVLQLLLSDNYESSTTKKPRTKTPPTRIPHPVVTSTKKPTTTTNIFKEETSTVNPFIPLPALPYFPPKDTPTTVNRIDHLVLGEATAIKKTTPRPITNKTTKRPIERSTESSDVDLLYTSGPRPPNLSSLAGSSLPGTGILKLAGCNIYGRMYRVGRIIAELSSPCQECWCTELGVQCKPLEC